MAGRGPAPKPRDSRARRNKDSVALKVIEFTNTAITQPQLPDFVTRINPETGVYEDEIIGWPQQTRDWWDMWAKHPVAGDFTESDWQFLLDTAIIHRAFWLGNMSAAAELRIRVAKFGATPEDRQRLRIQFAVAEEAEAENKDAERASARSRMRKKLVANGD